MKTVTDVITRFRRYFSDCDTTTAADLFQTAYKRLLDKAQLRLADVAFSSIVADTREYTWAEADLKCWGVTWYTSVTDFNSLTPVSEDELRDCDPDWKEDTTSGTPCRFYIAGRTDASSNKTGKLVIGFDPIPDTTTSGGYPQAVAHTSQHAAITGATELPYSLLDEMYFVYYMCELWCEENGWIGPSSACGSGAIYWNKKRVSEESAQIQHLHSMVKPNEGDAVVLPPKSAFTTRIT